MSGMNNWFAYVHEGYAKYPCTQSACSQGFAVRSILRYRRRYGRVQEGPLCMVDARKSICIILPKLE